MIFKIINGKAVRYDSDGTEKIDDLTVDFSQAESRENISPTDSMKTILGKIMKWFSDLSAGAASSLLGQNLTAGKVLVSDDGGKVAASAVDASKVGFLSGVTSDVQGQINSLNSAMEVFSAEISRPATTNIFTEFTNFTVKYYKYGKIVTLMLNIAGNFKASGDFVTLLDIPKGYYPVNTLTQNYITQSGDAMGISIRAAGDIQLYNGNKDVTGWYCRQVLTYVTN